MAWKNFNDGIWQSEINVADFIKQNYKEYSDDDSFLSKTTSKTDKVLSKYEEILKEELAKGIIGIDTENISGIDAFAAGYIDKENEVVVGIQTEKPGERIYNPFGGLRMAKSATESHNYKFNAEKEAMLEKYVRTHNDGVFSAYDSTIRAARKSGLITGLPDAYGRGRIIGDYRRVALYGVDRLMEEKKNDWDTFTSDEMTDELIRLREEIFLQHTALAEMKSMAMKYGFDISMPATNAREAVQWTYFAYLAGIKQNNGAATSMGRIDAFLDIYIERDLKAGIITEAEAQELIDQFVIKMRLVRHLRTPEYDELFSGDPTWVTCAIGGLTADNNNLVTKTSYRLLHTLVNLKPAPEPNMTILWSENLPENFKKYCAKISIDTDSIQYENDDIMRPVYGDDYAIACCVSAMRVGKDMQLFGARCNLAKALLYAINGGVDEISGAKVMDGINPISDEVLDYDKLLKNFELVMKKLATTYAKAMNIIHYMHDKYAYESIQMALHDSKVHRYMAYGVAGLSVVADSLSAVKFATVKPVRNEEGIAIDFDIKGEFPKYGNDNDEVDAIALTVLNKISDELKSHKCYKGAEPTLSVLTITSNVVYGKKTGTTPDGRKKGVPFAPGANPMHQRDEEGAVASLNSVAKINYQDCCKDGISNTFTITPNTLGKDKDSQINNLVGLLDGYFTQGAHHLNVNVLNKETLKDAMENPDKYPLLTIRVSGYAVRFNRLKRKQQEEVIERTFHEKL